MLKLTVGVILSSFLSLFSYRRKSLSLSGSIAAFLVGLSHSLVGVGPVIMLLIFFVSSSFWTKFKSKTKSKIEHNHKEGGQRDWKQVCANGILETIACVLYIYYYGTLENPIDFSNNYDSSSLMILILGGYAASNGDTWASEIGVLSSGTVFLITSCKKVPKGTNGGITLLGTTSSIIGGFVVALGYFLTNVLYLGSTAYSQFPILIIGVIAGFLGSVIDSFLGATLEYSAFDSELNKVVSERTKSSKHISGLGIISSNQVNFISIVITSFCCVIIAPYLF